MRTLGRLAALGMLFLAAPARAQMDDEAHARHAAELDRMRERAEASKRPASRHGRQPEHDGFYFRADSGYGYMAVTVPLWADASYSGPAAIAAFHVGATVQDRALLGLQLWAATLRDPKGKIGDKSQKLTGTTVGNLGIGPELTVYFMPSNVYVSSAVGLTWLTVANDDGSDTSKAGIGGRVTAGAEWWLTRKWGLGLAAALSFSANKATVSDLGGTLPFQAWNLGAVLSVTYN